MSTQYNGLPANVAQHLPGSVAITAASNASPIVVTVAGHGCTTGDVVDVQEVRGNTAANGRWAVVVVDANDVQLWTLAGAASTGNAAFTAGGSPLLIPRSFGVTYAIPSDGDDPDGASVDVALEALGDRTAHLEMAGGSYIVASEGAITHDDSGLTDAWGSITTNTTNYTVNATYWTIPGLQVGDVLHVELTTTGFSLGASGYNALALDSSPITPGGTPSVWTKLAGSGVTLTTSGSASPNAVSLQGRLALTGTPWGAGVSGGSVCIATAAQATATAGSISFTGDYCLRYKVLRAV